MIILGIETSCDETAAAVVKDGIKILSNVVASSAEMHAKTGGIIPEQAARQQVKSIIPVIDAAMTNAKCQMTNVDTIVVTVGPGLIGSLLVGIETAKTLAYLWNKPIVPVNHLAAHIYANWLNNSGQWTVGSGQKNKNTEHRTPSGPKALKGRRPNTEHKIPLFPTLCLVVSGGHTDLVIMRDHGKLEWIGGTRDDAAGEAFDKTARLLGMGYPGGPAIAAEAAKCKTLNDKCQMKMFPRPMIGDNNYDFSFSGLKTAVLRQVSSNKNQVSKERLAAEVQEAIVDVLVYKTLKATKKYKPRSLLLAGGVAANTRLREKFKLAIGHLPFSIDFHVPPPNLCTDNAAYIASCAYFSIKGGCSPTPWQKIKADPQLTITGEV